MNSMLRQAKQLSSYCQLHRLYTPYFQKQKISAAGDHSIFHTNVMTLPIHYASNHKTVTNRRRQPLSALISYNSWMKVRCTFRQTEKPFLFWEDRRDLPYLTGSSRGSF